MMNRLEVCIEEVRGKIEKVLFVNSARGILSEPIGILQWSNATEDLRDYAECLPMRDAEVVQLTGDLFVYNNDDILEYYHLSRF